MKKVNRLRKKMQQNGRFFIPSLVLLAAMGAGVYGISSAGAQSNNNQTSIVERLASTFNLSKDEVQKVFDAERADRQSQMEADFEKKLNDAVASGSITEAQKTLIMNKRAEMKEQADDNRDSKMKDKKDLRDMTDEERSAEMTKMQSEMKARKEALEAWAKENGIDIKYLAGPMGGHGGPGGPDGGFHGEGADSK